MAAGARGLRHILRRYRRVRIRVCLDGVYAVAVRADWCLPVGFGNGLAMNALLEFLGDLLVALAASHWYVEFEDGGFRVFGVQNFMRAVTIGADRRFLRPVGDGVSVNALLIRGDRLNTQSAALHHKLLAVAGSATRRNIAVMHARLGIGRR
jgi:hypothetical protein